MVFISAHTPAARHRAIKAPDEGHLRYFPQNNDPQSRQNSPVQAELQLLRLCPALVQTRSANFPRATTLGTLRRVRPPLSGAALLLVLATGSCGPDPTKTTTPSPTTDFPAPPEVPAPGPLSPYQGTWDGPRLRLSFAGPWVLVTPIDGPPTQIPIELRATVLRREGRAFALETSIAGVMPADFLRPTDWTLLAEEGALALAMGDEPLETYTRVDDPSPPLLGPPMLDELPLPEALAFVDASACLERASLDCAALEADGPRAAGCREALWAACAGHLLQPKPDLSTQPQSQPDPDAITGLDLHLHHIALRYAAGLSASPWLEPRERSAALAFQRRELSRAAALLTTLHEAGGPPPGDPNVGPVTTYLRLAITAGDLPASALPATP